MIILLIIIFAQRLISGFFGDIALLSFELDMHTNMRFSRAQKIWQDTSGEAKYCATEEEDGKMTGKNICHPSHPPPLLC